MASILENSYNVPAVMVVVLVILLVLIFNKQLAYWISSTKRALVSTITGKSPNYYEKLIPDESDETTTIIDESDEFVDSEGEAIANGSLPSGEVSDTLTVMGMGEESQPWDEVIAATELDPSTFSNHQEFVKDTRRFSSGSNFTSVNDADTNSAFTNFVGLRRPTAVPIGPTARQQPDVDQSVLMRNKSLRFNGDTQFNKFY